MIALFVSWLLMFIALRFIVGPANRREHEKHRAQGRPRRDELRHQAVLPADVLLPDAALRVERDLVAVVVQLVARAAAARLRGGLDDGSRVRQLHHGAPLLAVGDVRARDVRRAQRDAAAGRRARSPDRPDRRRGRDAGVGRAAVVLDQPGAVAAGRAADGRDDRGALLGRASGTGARSIPPAPLAMPETAVGHGTLG